MPLGGALIGRFGSARMMQISGFMFIVLLPMPVLSSDLPLLALSLAAFGLSNGVMDVAMNAHGVLVERNIGKPVVSSFHAMWSVGGLIGSACGGWALVHIGPVAAVLSAAALALIAFGSANLYSLPSHLDRQMSEAHFAMDWSGVYLRDLEASPALAASGFAGFSGTRALGRFFGAGLRSRFGAGRLVQVSGLISLSGLSLALASPFAQVATIGFALMGIGIANIAPVIYGAARRLKGVASGASIASVITMGYAGFMVGPAVIGFVAHHISLFAGLGLIGLACALMAALGMAADS